MKKEVIGFAAATCLLYVGYVTIGSKYKSSEPAQNNSTAAVQTASSTPAVASTATSVDPAIVDKLKNPPSAAPDDLKVETPSLKIQFLQQGGCLNQVYLKDYKQDVKAPDNAELFGKYELCKALGIKLGDTDLRQQSNLVTKRDPLSVDFAMENQGVLITRSLTFANDNSDTATLNVQLKNLSKDPKNIKVSFEVGAGSDQKHLGSFFSGTQNQFHEAIVSFQEEVKRTMLPFEESPKQEQLAQYANIIPNWVASGSLYFMFAMIPRQQQAATVSISRTGFAIQKNKESAIDRTVYENWLEYSVSLSPEGQQDLNFKLFLGPKTKARLDALNTPFITQVIDYGFFKIVAWPIYTALALIVSFVHNWGLAIILLTIVLKILFYPLTLKAFLAGKKMQKIQPQIQGLKEKFKDDKQAQSQEMMRLMSQNGANPMSGCLPILPQMPVFFALYAVLQHTFELRHAHFAFWIKDLSAMDPYYVSAVIMAVLMFTQQKLTPMPSADPMQVKMMQFMPLIFAGVMITMPSGLVLYIITSTAVSILQQQYIDRKSVV